MLQQSSYLYVQDEFEFNLSHEPGLGDTGGMHCLCPCH